MLNRYWVAIIVLVLASLAVVLYTTRNGDSEADMRYRGCVEQICFPLCMIKSPWEKMECQNYCRRHCKEKELPRDGTVKYYGKWPFRRAIHDEMQAFASVVCCVLIFAMHIRGWSRLWFYLYRKMPLNENNMAFYDYACLWHTYGLLSLNSWFWGAAFHARDIDLTEKLNYSSALALLGYSLVAAIIRSFNFKSIDVKTIADSFAVAAPPIAFVTSHIMYLNTYRLDYGWNMKVCIVLVVAELTIWGVWAGVTQQYLRWKIWLVVVGGGVAMLLEIYDLASYKGLIIDTHFLRYASTIPLTSIWWEFIQDEAESLTIIDLTRRMKYDDHENVNPPETNNHNAKPIKKNRHGKKRK